MGGSTRAREGEEQSREGDKELCMGLGTGMRSSRLVRQGLYPLKHLSGPHFPFLTTGVLIYGKPIGKWRDSLLKVGGDLESSLLLSDHYQDHTLC